MSAHAFTATADNFLSDVVEASHVRPVLVDFWAEWCGPCKQLMPVLDRLADDYAGRFALAKVNTDEQQELAGSVGVRSLPTVALFKDGQVVDHFVGAVPETQVRQMLDKHLPPPAQSPREQARALRSSGNVPAAIALLETELENQGDNLELVAELGELRVIGGEIESARRLHESLRAREPGAAPVKRLGLFLDLADGASAAPRNDDPEASPSTDPSDLDESFSLSVRRFLGGDIDGALQEWLTMLRSSQAKKDDRARKALLTAFELLDKNDPRVAQTRRTMAGLLF